MKWFALIGFLLFFGVAVAPSINADVKKTSIAHTTPLFQTRTLKVLNQENEISKYHFLGENQQTCLVFGERKQIPQIIIDFIQKVDEKTFETFIVFFISHLNRMNIFKNYNSKDIPLAFDKIRNSPMIDIDSIIIELDNSPKIPTPDIFHCTIDVWGPGCFIKLFFDWVWAIAVIIQLYLQNIFNTFNC